MFGLGKKSSESVDKKQQIKKDEIRKAIKKKKGKRRVRKVIDVFAAILVFGCFAAAVGYPLVNDMVSVNHLTGEEPIGDVKTTDVSGEDAVESTEKPSVNNYEIITVDNDDVFKGCMILVNEDYPFKNGSDADIVTLYDEKNESYSVSGMEIGLQSEAVEPLNNMLNAFYEETGHNDILIVAGFRTLEQQQALYDEDLERTGLDTSTLVALPGHSEHESGYALDFSLFFDDGTSGDYDGTGDYEWIDDHCADYGYILRYPSDKTEITKIQYESWHYRYVGKPHAYYIMQKGICYEEYMEEIKNYSADSPFEIVDSDGEAYAVYYVPAETEKSVTYVPLISDKPYTISGNNSDGFIVTIDLKEKRELVSYTTPAEDITGITTDEYGNVVTNSKDDTVGIITDEYGDVVKNDDEDYGSSETTTVPAVG